MVTHPLITDIANAIHLPVRKAMPHRRD